MDTIHVPPERAIQLGTGLKRHLTGTGWLKTAHPELHHYCGFQALKGIWESNCLWATRYSHLNDATEVRLMREPLIAAALRAFEDFIRQNRRFSAELDQFVSRHHGAKGAAKTMATEIITKMFELNFEEMQGRPTLAAPYVTCFCSHASDKEYERQNGLLSQWRAYGREGYCIVFDGYELARLLAVEWLKSVWIHINLDAVTYHDDDFVPEKYFSTVIEALLIANSAIIADIKGLALIVMSPFIESATLLKHRGFKEEREFRIIASPCTPAYLETVREGYPGYDPGVPLKQLYERTDAAIPYIKLFETLQGRLPIKRVIVGPSKRQDENFNQARAILGGQVELIRSETPYIG